MSEKQHALDNLERINQHLDSRASYILRILINAGLPCREYADTKYLENLADSIHNLWHHLCQLDTGNIQCWDMNVLELASIYGEAMGARTFYDDIKPSPDDRLRDALGEMIRHFETFLANDQSEFSTALTKRIIEDAKDPHTGGAHTEAQHWPTTGSEESFRKLSSEEMLEAGFTLDSCTYKEFSAYRDKCDEEEAADYHRTNDAMDKLSDDLNPVKPEGGE